MARLLTKQLRSPTQSIFRKVSLGGIFVAWLTVLHLLLEMLGRQYVIATLSLPLSLFR